MTAVLWLLPAALFLGLLGLTAFLWSMKSGQYEDLEGAAWRAIIDDDDDEFEDDAKTQKRPDQS
ncbi:MAG: hypothetical protein Alpg2KO_24220 [Alphaproteobacteria bacterium]